MDPGGSVISLGLNTVINDSAFSAEHRLYINVIKCIINKYIFIYHLSCKTKSVVVSIKYSGWRDPESNDCSNALCRPGPTKVKNY